MAGSLPTGLLPSNYQAPYQTPYGAPNAGVGPALGYQQWLAAQNGSPPAAPIYTTPSASGAGGGSSPVAPSAAGNSGTSFLQSIIPGYSNLSSQVTGVIGNLLSGTPSPATVRNAAATFSSQNGLGSGSGLANNYGYNLYNQLGQQNQQTGMADLDNLIASVSSPTLSNQGQQLQNSQFGSNLSNTETQENTQNQLQQFLAQLQGLDLGNSIAGNGYQLPAINY